MTPAARSRGRGEAGLTLIECIIAIFIVSSVVAAGAAALLVTNTQTRRASFDARTELAASNVDAFIKRMPYYTPCSSRGGTYPANNSLEKVYESELRTWLGATTPSPASSIPAGFLSGSGGQQIKGISATSFSITQVEYWNAITNAWDTTKRCNGGVTDPPSIVDKGIQRITVVIDWGTESVQEKTILVVKSKRSL